jgi:tetratricopeptide (TPR) repeat protein
VPLSIRAQAYLGSGDYDAAIRDCTEAMRIDPNIAVLYVARAAAKASKNLHDEAIADATQAMRLDASFAWAWLIRGQSSFVKDDFDAAMKDCTEAIRLDPSVAAAYAVRGQAHFAKGERDEAIRDCDECLRINPRMAEAYCVRGAALARKRHYDKALADYAEANRLDATLVQAHNNAAWILATCADDRLRNGRQAVEHATEACRLTGWKEAGYIDTLAASYAEAGDFLSAIRYEEQAIGMAESNAQKQSRGSRRTLYVDRKAYRDEAKK